MAHQNLNGRVYKWPVLFSPVVCFLVRNLLPSLFLFLQLFLLSPSKSQSVNDTLFYDKYWRICERQVADYYRTGELQLGAQWHFVNDIKDHYAGGQPEMTGHYSSNGARNGVFTFYHPNGKQKKSGAFVNNVMKGTWSYYDASGELYFRLNCDEQPFTPLFIKNPGGDVLLKDGTGRFAFKLLDYPDVFPDAMDVMVKGQCGQGKRTGEWVYNFYNGNSWHLLAKEVYEAGVFQAGSEFRGTGEENELKHPASIGKPDVDKLAQTESFAHDLVFGESDTGPYPPQLTNFLLRGDIPVFGSGAKKIEANVQDYLSLCAAAIGYGRLGTGLVWHSGERRPVKSGEDCWLMGYCVQTTNRKIMRQSDLFPVEKLTAYFAQIHFTLYEDGTTSDVSVRSNFERGIVSHLAYYLSRLTGLAPLHEAGKATAAAQSLYVFTKANVATHRGHSYIVYRLLFSLKPQELANDRFNITDFTKEDVEDDGY